MGFGEQHSILYQLVGLEKQRKTATEEFEEFDIPCPTKYGNQISGCFDIAVQTLSNSYDHFKVKIYSI